MKNEMKMIITRMRKNIDIVWEGIIRFIPRLRKVDSTDLVPAMKARDVVWVRPDLRSNHLRRKQGARR